MHVDGSKRLQVALTALRGVVMIIAAVFAFALPAQAVKFVLLVGGGLLLVDGSLGLASMDFARQPANRMYLALARNLLCIAAGLIVLTSAWLTGVFTLAFLAGLVGFLVILAGLAEIASILMDYDRYSSSMMAMLGGALYVVAGLALMFVPLSSAAVLMRLATILLIVYALSLIYRAWRIRAHA